MKKRDSFIRIPAAIKSASGKKKGDLFGFIKRVKLPKFKLPALNLKKNGQKRPMPEKTNLPKSGKGNIFMKMTGGIRGRIILLVIIITLIPLGLLTYFNINTQTHSIEMNMQELNKAANQGMIERINAFIYQSLNTLELVPKAVDILALDRYQQERIIRKIASSQQADYREITLADQYGIVSFSMNPKLNDTNIAGSRWFMEAMKGKSFISDSYVDSKKTPVFDIAVPVLDMNSKPIGVLSAKIGLDDIQTMVSKTKVGENGIAYIIDKNGVVLAHPEYKAKVLDGYNTVTNMIEGPVKVIKGEEGTSVYDNDKGQQVNGTYYRIPLTGWGLITEIGVEEAMHPVREAAQDSVVLMLGAIVIAMIGSLLLAFIITKPLVNMSRVAGEIKDGNLNKRLKVTSKDEIGDLQVAFNQMADALCGILTEVSTAVTEITEAAATLSQGAHISTAATEEIAAIVEDVAMGSQSQIESVRITSGIAAEISHSVEDTARKTQAVADKAEEAAGIAQEGSSNISIINEKIGIIKENVVNSAALVEKLGSKSAEVTGIVKIIRDIAGKTNMLALNAAIEAARAGDAGKGFAVVANEIRNLAEQTRDASKDIETLLLEIRTETDLTVTAMNQGLIEVERGTAAITATSSTFEKIINDIRLVANEVKAASNSVLELRNETAKVINAVDKVNTIADATSKGTQNVLASTEEQSSAMQEINASASRLSGMAKSLMDIVSRFQL